MALPSTNNTASSILDEQLARQHHRREQYARHLGTTRQLKEEWDELTRADSGGQASLFSDIDYSDLLGGPLLDIGTAHRALVRSRFKPNKAAEVIVDGLRARARHALDAPAPAQEEDARIQAYAASEQPLFAFLDPERCVDRLGRPVAVLTLRSISSDLAKEREVMEQEAAAAQVDEKETEDVASEVGSDMIGRPNLSGRSRTLGGASNDGLREWCWWISELARRVLTMHYASSYDGAGCVLLVDSKGAGIKDLELELLPHLINVNHNHFPGLFESVFVINYSWAHSGLWSCIRRVLPQAALDKIQFLRRQEVGEVFDLETLPVAYGGQAEGVGPEPRPGDALARCYVIEYPEPPPSSVRPTPLPSRRASISSNSAVSGGEQQDLPERYRKAASSRMQMTKLEISTSNLSANEGDVVVEDASEPPPPPPPPPPSSTLQRIRSLGDFRLYLSPSRRTHIDILLGSDDELSEGESERPVRRNQGRGGTKSPSPSGMPRAPFPPDERSRTYSATLQEHHARALSETRERLQQQQQQQQQQRQQEVATTTPEEQRPPRRIVLPISAYDRMANPMFGYPAVQSYANGAVEPQYGRKRKRDLIKTLLFLFLLRIASLRTWIGQAMTDFFAGIVSHVLFLGIPAHKLFGAINGGAGRIRQQTTTTPETAFALAQRRRLKDADQEDTTGEWIWLLMVLLVLRGAWGRASLGDWDVWRKIKGSLSRG